MARAAFAFVVPDGAQPGDVIQVPVLGILGRVKLPEAHGADHAHGGKCPCGLKYVVLRLKLTAIKRRNLPLWPKRGVVFFPN